MSRISEYIDRRVKREMNLPENVELWSEVNVVFEAGMEIHGIAVEILHKELRYLHAVKNKGRITKIETAEKFLAMAVPALQDWCRRKTGEPLEDNWYKPPKPKRRAL